MTSLALRVAAWLEAGRYTAQPQVAEALPSVWFAKEHRSAAEAVLERARAGVLIHCQLRKGQAADARLQHLMVWILEMPTEQDAALLMRYVGARATERTAATPRGRAPLDGRFSAGVASRRLFAILVAGSAQIGVAPFETYETLDVLAEGTRPLLDAALASD